MLSFNIKFTYQKYALKYTCVGDYIPQELLRDTKNNDNLSQIYYAIDIAEFSGYVILQPYIFDLKGKVKLHAAPKCTTCQWMHIF